VKAGPRVDHTVAFVGAEMKAEADILVRRMAAAAACRIVARRAAADIPDSHLVGRVVVDSLVGSRIGFCLRIGRLLSDKGNINNNCFKE